MVIQLKNQLRKPLIECWKDGTWYRAAMEKCPECHEINETHSEQKKRKKRTNKIHRNLEDIDRDNRIEEGNSGEEH